MELAAPSAAASSPPGAAPFRLTPDLKFIFMTASHAAAAAGLRQALASGQRILVLAGEPGTGKTTLLTQLRREPQDGATIAYCPYPALSLAPMLQEFLGEPDAETGLGPHEIAAKLAATHRQRRLVLIVDDATRSPPRLLVDLCRVTALLSGTECTLQVVLAANVALLQVLNRSLAEADMPPAIGIELPSMETAEIGAYVEHRLAVAALPTDLFTADAIAEVARHAGGVARAINQICSRALMLSQWRQERPISAALVAEAIEDCPIDALVAAHFAQEAPSAATNAPSTAAEAPAPAPAQPPNDGPEGPRDLPEDELPSRSGDPSEDPGPSALEMPTPPSVAASPLTTSPRPMPTAAGHAGRARATPGRASWKLREIVRQRRLARADQSPLVRGQRMSRYAGFTPRRLPQAEASTDRAPAPAGPPRKPMRWPVALAVAAVAAGVLVYQRPHDVGPVVDALVVTRDALVRAAEDPRAAIEGFLKDLRAAFGPDKPERR